MRIVPVILRRKSRQSDPRLSVKVVASCRIPGKRKPVQLHLGYLSLMTEGGIAQGQRVKLLKNLRRKWLEHFHTEQVDIDWVVAERKLAERRAEVCDTREGHVKHEMSDGSRRPTRRLEPSTHVILFVAVNHRGGNPLKLGEECAEIQRELRMARNRDAFRFESRWAVSIDELMRHLTELDPTVVHFSGHGGGSIGLVLLDEQGQPTSVSGRALAMMVHAAARNVRLVVLNACYSTAQAEALGAKIDCVVGMDGAIGDDAARAFAIRFYGALGSGRSIGNAVAQGVATLAAKQLPDEVLPRCVSRDGVDPHEVILGAQP